MMMIITINLFYISRSIVIIINVIIIIIIIIIQVSNVRSTWKILGNIDHQRVSCSLVVGASVLDHEGSWVQFPSEDWIFLSSHLTMHNILHAFLTLLVSLVGCICNMP